MRTNASDLTLCIGPRSKTYENIEKRKAFSVALDSNGKLNVLKIGCILYESFSNMYLFLGDHVGMAWGEGKKFR